jgi:hypothetical protein
VEKIPECLILHGGEEPEVAVGNPFQPRDPAWPRNLGGIDERQLTQPGNTTARSFEYFLVAQSRSRDALFAIMENIDIAGVTRRVSVERHR